LRGFSTANRYGLVLALIVATYVVTADAKGRNAQSVVVLMQLLTVWIVFSVSGSRVARRIAGIGILVGAAITVGAAIVGTIAADVDIVRALFLLSALLYLIAPSVIVRHIFRRDEVDSQTVLGAISAYLLIGMMFSYLYLAIGAIQVHPPLYGAQGPGTASEDLFFSFVTLTTTGYGNLVPVANPGQTVAVFEAILGQLFLVTAVAKVITAWRTPAEIRRADVEKESDKPAEQEAEMQAVRTPGEDTR
jgi:hypothetical protein